MATLKFTYFLSNNVLIKIVAKLLLLGLCLLRMAVRIYN